MLCPRTRQDANFSTRNASCASVFEILLDYIAVYHGSTKHLVNSSYHRVRVFYDHPESAQQLGFLAVPILLAREGWKSG
jgi:hypothetical protein